MRTKMTDPRPGRPMPHLLNAALIALAAGGVLSLAPAGAAQGDAGAAADAGAARAPAEPPPRLPAGQAAAHFPLLADGGADAAGPAPDTALPSFAPLMKKVTPAVVSVFPAKLVQEGAADPLARFFGQADEGGSGERAMGVGSGVILSPDGWIVTNSHVVHLPSGMLADAINVELHDRRRFPAKLAGVDPMTDLALLKIEAPDLRPLPVGDSDAVEVGDLVFAVGNPFKVGMTATMGMVSATRRSGLNINGAGGYESFIQTDAAINPGNSGGALVDVRGRLVGVNTAIYGNGGGNIGIGFAIPSQIVRRIAIRLAEEGKVSRGFFGFRTEDVSPEQVKAAGLDAIAGAVVAEIMAGSPADKAGMEPGDIITRLGDAAVENLGDLRLRLSFIKPGETAVMELARGARRFRASLPAAGDPSEIEGGGSFVLAALPGVGFVAKDGGLVVEAVEPKAAKMGFEVGMAISEINGQPVTTVAEAEAALREGVNKVVTQFKGAERVLAVRIE